MAVLLLCAEEYLIPFLTVIISNLSTERERNLYYTLCIGMSDQDQDQIISDDYDNINVVVRVRPLSAKDGFRKDNQSVQFPGEGQVHVKEPGNNGKPKVYTFNVVFEPEANQDDVFEHCGIRKLIDMSIEGFLAKKHVDCRLKFGACTVDIDDIGVYRYLLKRMYDLLGIRENISNFCDNISQQALQERKEHQPTDKILKCVGSQSHILRFITSWSLVHLDSQNPFERIPVDQTVAETVNKATQASRGTKGLNSGAISRYYLTAEYRSAFLWQLRYMLNMKQ
ncbi:Kinesin-like protein KIF3A [Nymphon striatum]|nr:Kinesin-like protein KIF3A [Nymphon striatum]